MKKQKRAVVPADLLIFDDLENLLKLSRRLRGPRARRRDARLQAEFRKEISEARK